MTKTEETSVIQIHFEKEELEAYKAWLESIKPANQSRDEFNKIVFFMGAEAINESATEKINELIKENPEKFKKALDAAESEETSKS